MLEQKKIFHENTTAQEKLKSKYLVDRSNAHLGFGMRDFRECTDKY